MGPQTSGDEETILRPNPSGRRSIPIQPTKSNGVESDIKTGVRSVPSLIAGNAFTQRAVPVLNLVVALKTMPVETDFSRLKADFLSEINAFRNDLASMKFDPKVIDDATFGLSAYVDEVILSTPWAEKTRWADSCLLNTLYGVAWGGEQVAVILDDMASGKSCHPELICFYLTLLEMGYQGKFEIIRDGSTQRERTIKALSEQVKSDLTRTSLELSSQANVPAASTLNWKHRLPMWVVISVVIFVMLFLYLVLQSNLRTMADELALIQHIPSTISSGASK